MSETWVPDLQMWGPERQKALYECRKQLDAWALTMPDVEPLVIHFGLNDFWRVGEIEFWIVNEEKAGYCGKFLFVFDKQTCPCHHHELKHETFFVVKGKVKMEINGAEHIMTEGDRLIMPTGTRHSFTGVRNALLLEVSMPSSLNDNFFADKQIGKDGVI